VQLDPHSHALPALGSTTGGIKKGGMAMRRSGNTIGCGVSCAGQGGGRGGGRKRDAPNKGETGKGGGMDPYPHRHVAARPRPSQTAHDHPMVRNVYTHPTPIVEFIIVEAHHDEPASPVRGAAHHKRGGPLRCLVHGREAGLWRPSDGLAHRHGLQGWGARGRQGGGINASNGNRTRVASVMRDA
jgi:hypothetical protein